MTADRILPPKRRLPSPITPDEVDSHKERVLPPEVIEVFDRLIALHWTGTCATVKQDDVLKDLWAIHAPRQGFNGLVESEFRRDAIDKGWLNVESLYRAAGWAVAYDKPGFNESYPATFTFSKQRIVNMS